MSTEAEDIPAPRCNGQLIGQEAAEETLRRSYQSGRLPHAWLFTGPRGVGKATLAYRFARFLLSRDEATDDLFGSEEAGLALAPDHPVFRQVAAGTHANLTVLERRPDDKGKVQKVIRVDDVRRANSFLQHTAARGGWRVVIVDSADDLNLNAANALLKILEEPPARVVIMVIAHAEGTLLPTLRSRCCRLPMPALAPEQLEKLIGAWYPGSAVSDRDLLVRLSDGSPGRAADLARNGGTELYREMLSVLSELPRPPAGALHAFADRLARGRDDSSFRTGMDLLRWWVAALARHGTVHATPGLIDTDEQRLIARLLEWRPANFWASFWERLGEHARGADRANLDRKQVVLAAFLELETIEPGL